MIEQVEATWEVFWNEAEGFAKAAYGSQKKPGKFSPDIVYNIVSMSIEKYFMAYFVKNNFMPANHTLLDLVEGMKSMSELDEALEERLMHMNGFQEICAIDTYSRKNPSNEDVTYFIETLQLVSEYIRKKMGN